MIDTHPVGCHQLYIWLFCTFQSTPELSVPFWFSETAGQSGHGLCLSTYLIFLGANPFWVLALVLFWWVTCEFWFRHSEKSHIFLYVSPFLMVAFGHYCCRQTVGSMLGCCIWMLLLQSACWLHVGFIAFGCYCCRLPVGSMLGPLWSQGCPCSWKGRALFVCSAVPCLHLCTAGTQLIVWYTGSWCLYDPAICGDLS